MLASDRTVWKHYTADEQALLAAGYQRDSAIIPGRLESWSRTKSAQIVAAWDDREAQWKFRAAGREPSPVFTAAEPLLAWLTVEGKMG